jgi:hypothetical protein
MFRKTANEAQIRFTLPLRYSMMLIPGTMRKAS